MRSKSAMMSLLMLPLMMSGINTGYSEREYEPTKSAPTPRQKAMFIGEKPLSKKQKAKLKRKNLKQ